MLCGRSNRIFCVVNTICSRVPLLSSLVCNSSRAALTRSFSCFHASQIASDSLKLIYLAKRTTRRNARAAVSMDADSAMDESTVEEFLSDIDSKPNRKPNIFIDNENETSDPIFTITNMYPDEEQLESISDKSTLLAKPKTALDVALKMRNERGKEKSPFQSLVNEELDPLKRALKALTMPDLGKLSEIDLARLIRRNIIYADKKLVIFNKPYGLPMHDGDNTSLHVKSILPMVSKMIYGVNTNIPLTICNRLDKFTTGICVTTTDNDTTQKVQELFREHKILRKYWAITTKIPELSSGVIDIPLDRVVVECDKPYARMVAKPEVRYDALTNKKVKIHSRGQIAITHFNTLDSSALSLVELQPLTTIKHQLRVHLADGIDCPILGDHKYSHFGKLAPQILPAKILRRFGIPHSKSRYIPMHLHLKSILIPDIFAGRKKPHLIVGAKLPFHMKRTMHKFNLKPGISSKWTGVNNITASPSATAPPRDKTSKLYVDPTETKAAETLTHTNIEEQSVKVFRDHDIRVKYKHK